MWSIIEEADRLLADDIELEDLAYGHEDWSTVSVGRVGAPSSLNVLRVHILLLIEFVLDALELAEIILGHKHGSEVLI